MCYQMFMQNSEIGNVFQNPSPTSHMPKFGRDLLLQDIELLKLVGRHGVVIQSLRQKPVDCVTFGNGECYDLFMFYILDSSFLLPTIKHEETRARTPTRPPNGIEAGKLTTD